MKKLVMMVCWMMLPAMLMAEVQPWVGGAVGAMKETDYTRTGLIGGAEAGITFKDVFLGASLGVLHRDAEVSLDVSGNRTKAGDISITPVMFNFYGNIPINEKVFFRVGGGFSYIPTSFSLDESINRNLRTYGLRYDIDFKEKIGYQVFGATDFFFTKRVSVGFEVIYLFYKPDIEEKLSTLSGSTSISQTSSLKLDTLFGLMNVKYHF